MTNEPMTDGQRTDFDHLAIGIRSLSHWDLLQEV